MTAGGPAGAVAGNAGANSSSGGGGKSNAKKAATAAYNVIAGSGIAAAGNAGAATSGAVSTSVKDLVSAVGMPSTGLVTNSIFLLHGCS